MKGTKPESCDVSEVVSHETVGNRCCSLPNHTSSSRSGFHLKTFLQRHAFVILTMAAVVIGEWKKHITIPHQTYYTTFVFISLFDEKRNLSSNQSYQRTRLCDIGIEFKEAALAVMTSQTTVRKIAHNDFLLLKNNFEDTDLVGINWCSQSL